MVQSRSSSCPATGGRISSNPRRWCNPWRVRTVPAHDLMLRSSCFVNACSTNFQGGILSRSAPSPCICCDTHVCRTSSWEAVRDSPPLVRLDGPFPLDGSFPLSSGFSPSCGDSGCALTHLFPIFEALRHQNVLRQECAATSSKRCVAGMRCDSLGSEGFELQGLRSRVFHKKSS